MLKPLLFFALPLAAACLHAEAPAGLQPLLQKSCMECHDADSKKGELDLTTLKSDLNDAKTFATYVKIHDRVAAGEMPPPKQPQPEPATKAEFITSLKETLTYSNDDISKKTTASILLVKKLATAGIIKFKVK